MSRVCATRQMQQVHRRFSRSPKIKHRGYTTQRGKSIVTNQQPNCERVGPSHLRTSPFTRSSNPFTTTVHSIRRHRQLRVDNLLERTKRKFRESDEFPNNDRTYQHLRKESSSFNPSHKHPPSLHRKFEKYQKFPSDDRLSRLHRCVSSLHQKQTFQQFSSGNSL